MTHSRILTQKNSKSFCLLCQLDLIHQRPPHLNDRQPYFKLLFVHLSLRHRQKSLIGWQKTQIKIELTSHKYKGKTRFPGCFELRVYLHVKKCPWSAHSLRAESTFVLRLELEMSPLVEAGFFLISLSNLVSERTYINCWM